MDTNTNGSLPWEKTETVDENGVAHTYYTHPDGWLMDETEYLRLVENGGLETYLDDLYYWASHFQGPYPEPEEPLTDY